MLYLIIFFIVILIIYFFITNYISEKKIKDNFRNLIFPSPNFNLHDLKYIRLYWDIKNKHENLDYIVDDITWNDLDMDSLYSKINLCRSSVGSEYLYALLRTINFDMENLKEFGSTTDFMAENEPARTEVLYALHHLGKYLYNYTHKFIYEIQSQHLDNAYLYSVLGKIPIIGLIISFFHPAGLLIFFVACAVNMLIYYRNKYKFEISLNSIRYISKIIICANKLSKIDFGDLKYNQYLSENVEPLKKLSSLGNVIANKSHSDLEMIFEYIKIITMWDFINYNKFMNTLTLHKDEFNNVFKTIGRLDAAVSVFLYKKTLETCTKPVFENTDEITLNNMYHPLINKPVLNSIIHNQNTIITGSNASGKSTFIKALALNIICSQTIYLCFAKTYIAKPSFVITSMAIKDSIENNESYFIAEIKSLKRILDSLNDNVRCICFIDEILKGTNTIERISASASILNWLTDKNCLVMAASHDIELTEMLQNSYKNYHFREKVTTQEIVFDYKLYEGPALTKNAINLLKFMDFSPEIISKATKIASTFEKDKNWIHLNTPPRPRQ